MDSPRYKTGELPMLGDLVTPLPRGIVTEEYVVDSIQGEYVIADYTGEYETYPLPIETLHLIRRKRQGPTAIQRAVEAVAKAISVIREKTSHAQASSYFSPHLVHKIKILLLLLADFWISRPRDYVFSIYRDRVREGR